MILRKKRNLVYSFILCYENICNLKTFIMSIIFPQECHYSINSACSIEQMIMLLPWSNI